jgi:hypothetical protein
MNESGRNSETTVVPTERCTRQMVVPTIGDRPWPQGCHRLRPSRHDSLRRSRSAAFRQARHRWPSQSTISPRENARARRMRRDWPQLSWSRVSRLSQGQLNAFFAQKHRSEPLMIIEPEISFWRRDAAGADLCGAVFSSADTKRACSHNCHCDSNRDSNQLLAGWHDPPRSGRRSPYQPVLLMPSAECELAHTGQRARASSAAPWGDGGALRLNRPPTAIRSGQDDRRARRPMLRGTVPLERVPIIDSVVC